MSSFSESHLLRERSLLHASRCHLRWGLSRASGSMTISLAVRTMRSVVPSPRVASMTTARSSSSGFPLSTASSAVPVVPCGPGRCSVSGGLGGLMPAATCIQYPAPGYGMPLLAQLLWMASADTLMRSASTSGGMLHTKE